MKRALGFVAVCLAASVGRCAEAPVVRPYESPANMAANNRIDRLVFARLRRSGITPANLCSDQVFVRRVYLDVIGTLPTPQETRQFLQSRDPKKRSKLIDRLLERDEFADYWAMKWCDLLRVKAEFPINLWPNAVQAYHRWIRTAIRDNMPYDQFVREILTASGSNFRVPQVNFFRSMQSKEPEAIAQAVALTFMGARADKWPGERLADMAVFFDYVGYKPTAEWKEEIVYYDAFDTEGNEGRQGVHGRSVALPDGTQVKLSINKDPREAFADWLIAPANPWLALNIANRSWYWLMGRGIIHQPDDIRPGNAPSNPELLEYLERELLTSRYDVKHLFRQILNSNTYQLSSVPKSDHAEAKALFAYYPMRRLDAEVLIDALCQITGTTEQYSSPIPEPFTFIPEDERSIALADGSITSPFLEMFGRPPRDTGLESERNNNPSPAQRLHMLNSSHIQRKIERGGKLNYLLRNTQKPQEAIAAMYLTILSRFPTEQELKTVQAYAQAGHVDKRQAMIDLAWALVNSAEFLYRH